MYVTAVTQLRTFISAWTDLHPPTTSSYAGPREMEVPVQACPCFHRHAPFFCGACRVWARVRLELYSYLMSLVSDLRMLSFKLLRSLPKMQFDRHDRCHPATQLHRQIVKHLIDRSGMRKPSRRCYYLRQTLMWGIHFFSARKIQRKSIEK